MSLVWLATETALGRRVVLKVLPPSFTHALSADRFRQEIRVAARLTHPHIVPLLAAGTAGELLYYSMPFIEGDSLRARLQRGGELPVREALRVLRDVAAALAYAHEQGLVHRDIKPDNVLLAGGEALVTDFGVAKALTAASATTDGALTVTGMVLGTPAYMAPEQAAADPQVDHRADIYAWGCLAYECLTGRPPFAGRPASAQMVAHAVETPEPLARLRPSVPPGLAALVGRCLAKRPADRPQAASDLLAALEALDVPSGESTRLLPSVARPGGRRRAALATAALALLFVALLGARYVARRRAPVPPSAKVIAVLPLVPVSPDDTALARLGRDLIVTLGANLDGVGEMRTVDPLRILAALPPGAAVPLGAEALTLARGLGALSVLGGTLVRTGDVVRADLTLVDDAGPEPLARLSASAAAADVGALTDSITWGLLRQVWRTRGAPAPLFSAVTTSSLPALRAYLDGTRLSSEGEWRGAAEAFDRAIAADSTFWLAYMGRQFALEWEFQADSVTDALLRAHRGELPERERLLVEAGMADSATQYLERLRALVARYPDYGLAQWLITDQLFHQGPLYGHTLGETLLEGERTLQIQPGWEFVVGHLTVAASRSRDTAFARRVLGTRRASAPGLWNRLCLDLLVAPDAAARLADSVLATVPNASSTSGDLVMAAFLECGAPREQVAYSRRALARQLPPRGVRDHEGLLSVAWAMRGAWDSALVVLDGAAARYADDRVARVRFRHAVAAAWLGAVAVPEARRRRASDGGGSAEQRAEIWWMDGVLAYLERDEAALARARAAINGSGAATARDLDRSLGAFAAALKGDEGGAARQLARLERERAQLYRNDDAAVLLAAIDRLAASRWLAADGKVEEAIGLLQWPNAEIAPHFAWLLTNLTFSAPALMEEARLHERAGRPLAARRAYARFIELWDTPAPPLTHLVTEARQALARLPDAPADRR